MKFSKPCQDPKPADISLAKLNRTKLPRLQKPPKRPKKAQNKASSRNESKSCNPFSQDESSDSHSFLSNNISPNKATFRKTKTLITYNQTQNSPIVQLDHQRSFSSSDLEIVKPITKELFKYSERVFFARRPEMGNRNLLVLVFEGVIGEFFKENLWTDEEPELHLRKGVAQGLRLFSNAYQIALFLVSPDSSASKVLSYLSEIKVHIDAIYTSENTNRWKSKSNMLKKKLKYSENIQNYSQVIQDFNIQHETLSKMLIVTSFSMESASYFDGPDLLAQNIHSIPIYLCRGVPVLDDQDALLPITLAVPDPRIDGIGASMLEIVDIINFISLFSADFEEASWIEGFTKIRAKPQRNCVAFETSAYQFGLAQKAGRDSVLPNCGKCLCPFDMRAGCMTKSFGQCTVYKKMKNVGEDVKWDRNKFIVYKVAGVYPYRRVSLEKCNGEQNMNEI